MKKTKPTAAKSLARKAVASKTATTKNVSSMTSKNGTRPVMHRTMIDIPERTRTQVIAILNQSLADAFDLHSQTKQAHWNVKGKDFYQLHLLFDELAGEVLEYVDLIAERVTALGGMPMGTVRMAAKATELPEFPTNIFEGMDFVVALAERWSQFGASSRENIDKTQDLDDVGTSDLYTEIVRGVDKSLYFLEAHIQSNPGSASELTGKTLRHAARRK
ncbi:MAG: DNA starvation/stationary phase protection protein Dps [Candidatus Obscuribacterales bacterium]